MQVCPAWVWTYSVSSQPTSVLVFLGKSKQIVMDVGFTNLMESIAQQMQWVLGLRYCPRLIRWPNHDHCSCINLVSWILLSKTSNRSIKLKSLTVSRFTFMLDHVIYPWLDTLIVNLLVWNNSRLQPSNRPIKNSAISCFTFMIDTRIHRTYIIYILVYLLLLGFQLSTPGVNRVWFW